MKKVKATKPEEFYKNPSVHDFSVVSSPHVPQEINQSSEDEKLEIPPSIKVRKRASSWSGSEMCDSCSKCEDILSERHHDYLMINFSKDYLNEIPGSKLIRLIAETYPEYLDENK